MGDIFTRLDLVIFFGTLVAAMAVGIFAGRKEETAEDYFLAGRKIPWWGVAGSIFGSNVSANHMVGMMGLGFSVGFAQSHFELGAIAGLMLLCYGFLPVYRKLKLYTLSEYLGRRYDERSRIAYAVIMVIIMAIVQLGPALYIGGRSICVLIGDTAMQTAEKVAADGTITVEQNVNLTYYTVFVVGLALVAASYTIFGGLKAVVVTDVIQSVLLLAAGIVVAVLTFQAIGGWDAMIALDKAAGADKKMQLYLRMNHDKLPWTGVFTGLMAMHCFYWGTNQFIVQRALGAKSDREARTGIVFAGFLKLLIPFFAIAPGVAAVYIFKDRLPGQTVAPDTVFPVMVKLVIAPIGMGVIGLISAGLIGAILSTIDSMMNSSATIVTIDIYKRYINPDADDKKMILVGRLSIAVFITLATLMALFVLDPNSKKNFFLQIADYQNYLTPGLLVAFGLGMLWRRGTATAAIVTIIAGVVFSWAVEYGYNNFWSKDPAVVELFGEQLNFFHRVVVVIALCGVLYVALSLFTKSDEEKPKLTWTDLGGHDPQALKMLMLQVVGSIAIFIALAVVMVQDRKQEWISPFGAGIIAAAWTFGLFLRGARASVAKRREEEAAAGQSTVVLLLTEDRLWAGLLCGLAMFMMFFFYKL